MAKYDSWLAGRVSKETKERFLNVCKTAKISSSEAFREAVKMWTVDMEWKLKIRRLILDE